MNLLLHVVLLALAAGSAWYLTIATRNSWRSRRFYPVHMLIAALMLLLCLYGLFPGAG